MPYRKGEGYDWILMGFGVLIAAVFAQNREDSTLLLGLTIVLALFVCLRTVAWWMERWEKER